MNIDISFKSIIACLITILVFFFTFASLFVTQNKCQGLQALLPWVLLMSIGSIQVINYFAH